MTQRIDNTPYRSDGFENAGATFFAMIEGATGTAINQASISSIAFGVFADAVLKADGTVTAGAQVLTTGSCVVADTVFNALQTGDAAWEADGGSSAGYNFKASIGGTYFPTQGKYLVEFLFTLAAGGYSIAQYIHFAREVKLL